MTKNKSKSTLVKAVIELELNMFRTVSSTVFPPSEERLRNFMLMREMHHSIWPSSIVDAYLEEMNQAKAIGRNFISEKYACLEKRQCAMTDSHRIDELVATEMDWIVEITHQYPALLASFDSGVGEYIRCEYSALSSTTIAMISDFFVKAKAEGRNLIEERYSNLSLAMGYQSIQELEHALSLKSFAKAH